MARVFDERARQVAAAAVLLLGLTVLVCGTLLGWRYLPGLAGEWAGVVIGVMTTPFFMEASFVILGLVLVVALNSWKRKKAGEELVFLEQVDDPGLAAVLPDSAAWAIYPTEPLPGEIPSLREQAEGALAIGDFEQVGQCIADMDEAELRQRATLELRLALAKASGRHDLVPVLENAIQQSDACND
jgi:hypothetical protein